LSKFRADPANKGHVLKSGLWALTRHPNYFGDFAVWWGLWLFAFGCGAPFWTVVSPVVMSFFLMKVSGVTLLERDISERRPGYADYVRSTNAFFPGPRKKPQDLSSSPPDGL
jgi:steroid 5-alpha reductase family enzyme